MLMSLSFSLSLIDVICSQVGVALGEGGREVGGGLRYLGKWNAYEHWQLDMCHTFISEYNNRSRQQVES